jgi:hypothetical protein
LNNSYENSIFVVPFATPNMKKLHIQATENTPEIRLDFLKGELSITGRSIIKECLNFYDQLLQALDFYCDNPVPITIAHIQLDYFGDFTSRALLEIFKKLEAIHLKKSDVSINWYYSYEDKVMRETGQDYEYLLSIPFRLVELADEL